MELYEQARPELMAGKKIVYLHGFAGSGAGGSVRTLRLLLPEATVMAPDIPVEPHEALAMIRSLCDSERPDLVIGASMGGMFAEQLTGRDRILFNPAFHLADTLLKNNGLGRQDFHSPRADGQTSFMVTKSLLEAYREVSSGCFASCGAASGQVAAANADAASEALEGLPDSVSRHTAHGSDTLGAEAGPLARDAAGGRVYGLFGRGDTLVSCFDEFASHYASAVRFDGDHYMTDHVILHSLLPVIQWIDDAQEGRRRRVLMVDMEGPLRCGNVQEWATSRRAFAQLSRWYDAYVLIHLDHNHPGRLAEGVAWVDGQLGVPAWNRVVCTGHKELLMADYLIAAQVSGYGVEDFMGTVIHYGSAQFRTWDDILTYFSRLHGQ